MSNDGTSDTSYWIKFFMEAGIPASDSAHYAVKFSDNRIVESMLMDLSKDYLNDMGISRLGDVIAILKRAKDVYNKLLEERVLSSGARLASGPRVDQQTITVTPSQTQSTGVQTRKDSPLTRIVGRCLASANRRSQSPVTVQTSTVTGINARLGPERTTTYKPTQPRTRRNIYIPEDPTISLPSRPASYNTPIAEAPAIAKKSVFERLGDNSTTALPAPRPTLTKSVSDSVFNRLGGKRAAPEEPLTPGSPPLQYAGVLVSPPKRVKPAPPSLKIRTPNPAAIDPSLPSSTSEGIFSDSAALPKRLKDRLGKVVSPADTTETSSTTQHTKLTIVTKNAASALTTRQLSGSNTSEVSSSSDPRPRPSILDRLGKQL